MRELRHDCIRKILIRSVNWLGDAVMTTPAISIIREQYPHAEISLLANPMVSQLFLHHTEIDRIITFDRAGRHRGVAGRVRLAMEIKKQRYDLAVILPNSFDSALVPWLAGIPQRIGKCSDGRTLLLTGRYDVSRKPESCHEVEYYLHLLNSFGITGKAAPLHLTVTDDEEAHAGRLLASYNIHNNDFILGINPGASYGSAKRWYPDRFAAVAKELSRMWGAKVVIFGGPGETKIAEDIEAALDGAAVNFAGRTSVRELMALIRHCSFFVTNDSGPMHIAAAFDVPQVAIFGSTDHTGTSPYNSRSVVVRAEADCAPCKLRECPTDHRCMTAVSADMVISAAVALREKFDQETTGES